MFPGGSVGDTTVEETTGQDRFTGRVLEALDTTAGHRIYRVRVIAYGDSRNGRRYSENVMRAAVPLYDGAKAYDHHRSDEEMKTGTIQGLVGHFTNAVAGDTGIEADLHLLPSAHHSAEVLDASLAAQDAGYPPLAGISHDVFARFRQIHENGRPILDAIEITSINSADIVSDPAAGGQATRAVAGGSPVHEESTVPDTPADVLNAAIREATDDELAAVGLTRVSGNQPATTTTTTVPATVPATETVQPTTEVVTPATTEPEPELWARESFWGRQMIDAKVTSAGLPQSTIAYVSASLPDKFTESQVDTQIAAVKTLLGDVERAGLTPTVTTQVTTEALDKKKAALDAFFAGDYRKGYKSFREAFIDVTGYRPVNFDEDFNKTVLRETYGGGYGDGRTTESMTTASWDVILGDSITRRMVAEYGQPSLMTWQQVVSNVIPVSDFRTQRLERLGGYGILPAVAQGAPYVALTSPTDEEATYAITKRGGTEDLTLEMIANDDLRAIQRIPVKLGRAAAVTLYRFVFDMFTANAATTYDATALFHVNHANTANPALLSQSTLSVARTAMRQQAAYGEATNILSLIPRTLIVPSALEEIAYQLTRSAVAIPATPAGPTDTPNIHQGMDYIVVDYYSDANDWYLVADTSLCPTIELGFYQGRLDPELFTQADQTVGSMFNSDKLTYKIRHIYSGAVIDHRGFYRGANA